jgi:hypothetical protein
VTDSVLSANVQLDGASFECCEAALHSFAETFCLPFASSTFDDNCKDITKHSQSSGRCEDQVVHLGQDQEGQLTEYFETICGCHQMA